jgi:hypothetical protein
MLDHERAHGIVRVRTDRSSQKLRDFGQMAAMNVVVKKVFLEKE